MKIKRKVFVSMAMAFFVLTLLATAALAVPLHMQTINYQGRLANPGGVPVNGPVSITFSIYNASSGGSSLWTENHPIVTVTDGAFSVVLGEVSPINLPFDEQYYLGVDVNSDGEMEPRAVLLSVPYSMRAKEADSADTAVSADTADTLDGQDSSAFAASSHVHSGFDITSGIVSVTYLNTANEVQRRVIGSCAPGTSIRIVNADGSATCEFDNDTTYTPGTGIDITGTQINNIGDTNPSDDLTVGTTFSGDVTGTYNALNIASGAVTTAEIADGTVTGAKLSVPFILGGSTSGSPLVSSTNTGTESAGYFGINNTANFRYALYANTNGSGSAVHGYSTGTGRAGLFTIYNTANTNDALLANTNGSGNAVYGYTSGTGSAGYFEINNYSSDYYAIYAKTNGNGPAVYAQTTGTGHSGEFFGGAGVNISGNLNVSGTLTKSAGSFVQPHPTDPSKELVYAFFEGPEHAVFLRGTGRLVDGKAIIDTPEHFRAVAGEEGITVQFTPRFENTIGLAAVEVTKERIVVKERMGGKNTYEFDYFITAKRAGFEAHEPIQPNTHFTADMKTAEEFEEAYAKDDMTISAMRRLLVSNGILTADGKLNMELARELGWVVKDSDVALKEAE